jgi:ribonuclease HI
MYFDGSLKLGGGGAGVLFISPRGEKLKYVLQILFEVSNNEAEYEALLHGLCVVVSQGIKRLLSRHIGSPPGCNHMTSSSHLEE